MDDLRKQAEKYVEKETKLQEKYGLKREAQIIFPMHDKPPLLGKFALWLLRKKKAQIVDGLTKTNHGSTK